MVTVYCIIYNYYCYFCYIIVNVQIKTYGLIRFRPSFCSRVYKITSQCYILQVASACQVLHKWLPCVLYDRLKIEQGLECWPGRREGVISKCGPHSRSSPWGNHRSSQQPWPAASEAGEMTRRDWHGLQPDLTCAADARASMCHYVSSWPTCEVTCTSPLCFFLTCGVQGQMW